MKYQAIPVPVQAIQLTDIAISYVKWGGIQHAKKGDWLISKGGEQYTCDEAVFAETYRPYYASEFFHQPEPGWFYKQALIEAEKATEDGTVQTLEGTSAYKAGDFIVTNPGGDRYCIPKNKFHNLYELVE